MNKGLAIITVNFENYQVTQDFLTCFRKLRANFKIFISDLSVKQEKLTGDKQKLEVIREKNKGYAYGVNLAIKKALEQGFNQFVVINNDSRVNATFVRNVIKSINRQPGSIIGGKIYYEKNYEYHQNRYRPKDLGKVIWYAGGEIDWNNVFIKHRGVDLVDQGQYDTPQKTDFVTGCLMFFDKSVVDKVGFWDESYFLYYEDADYCERAKRKGIRLLYDPSVVIWHKNAQSTEGAGSLFHQKYQNVNRLKFGLKYAPLKTKIHLIKNLFFKLPYGQ